MKLTTLQPEEGHLHFGGEWKSSGKVNCRSIDYRKLAGTRHQGSSAVVRFYSLYLQLTQLLFNPLLQSMRCDVGVKGIP